MKYMLPASADYAGAIVYEQKPTTKIFQLIDDLNITP